MKRYLLLIISISISSIIFGQVSETYNGTTNNFSTLKGAFDNINSGVAKGVINITFTGSTTESSTAILNASGMGAASYTSITISTSGNVSVSGDISGSLITLNGASGVVIDGKHQLIINNINQSGNTLSLINDASRNKILNTTIKGASTSESSGVVFLGAGVSTGNDDNKFDGCDIDGSSLASNCINSSGSISTQTIENSSDTVNNCNLFNNMNSVVNSASIFLNYGSTNWNISGNSFYQTGNVNSSTRGIFYAIHALPQFKTDTHQITDNFIGGNAPKAAGTMVLSGTGSTVIGFIGMDIETGGSNNLIKNNLVKNVTLTFNNTSFSFQNAGIFCYLSQFNGTSTISNNTVSDFNFINNSGVVTEQGISCTVQASDFGATKDTFYILNNTITNLTGNSGGSGNVQMYGIRLNSNSAPNLTTFPQIEPYFNVHGNSITNCTAPFAGSNTYIRGISNLNTQELFSNVTIIPTYVVTENVINSFSTNSILSNYTSGVVEGIKLTGGLGTSQSIIPRSYISKNIISNLKGNQTGNSSIAVIGIYTSNAGYTIEQNKIFDLFNKATASSVTPYILGIHVRSTIKTTFIQNNFISLGNNVNSDMNIFGILNSFTTDSINIYYNSISINGAGSAGNKLVTADVAKVSAVLDDVSTNLDLKNNILINNRAAGPSNYALYTPSSRGWMSNYNDLYTASPSTLSYYNNSTQDFGTYKSISKQDANSVSVPADFTEPVSGDLHLKDAQAVLKAGIPLNAVATDFDNKARDASTPFMGADEFGAKIIVITPTPIYNGIYPNPVTSLLFVRIPTSEVGEALITLSNIVGQKVHTEFVRTSAGSIATTINMEKFSRGIYFIRIQLNNLKVVKKILKI